MHFTLGLIIDDLNLNESIYKQIDGLMEPFDENTENPKYLKFKDLTEEYMEYYNNPEITETIVLSLNGEIIMEREMSEEQIKQGYKIVELPVKEIFKTFEEYMEYDGEQKDKKTNKYGYWYNPNCQFDYYDIGGRWNDIVLFKNDDKVLSGNPDFFGYAKVHQRVAPEGYVYASVGLIKNIAFEKMLEENYKSKSKEILDKIVDDVSELDIKNCFAFSTYALLIDNQWYDTTSLSKVEYAEFFKKVMTDPKNQEKYFVLLDCHI